MRRDPFGPRGSPTLPNGGIIVAPPLVELPPRPTTCPPCPTFPPIAEWDDIPNVFPTTPGLPAQATLTGVVFLAEPGPDTATTYTWNIDTAGIAVPYMCRVLFASEAAAIANFRAMTVNGFYLQEFTPPYSALTSPYFMLRPGDVGPIQISTYQPNTSFGDPENGMVASVSFRMLCIPVTPAG